MTPSLVVLAAVFGASLLSMPVFALQRRGPDADAVRRGSTFLLGVGNFVVHWLMWVITPIERVLLRLGFGPDSMNLGGLLFGIASGVLIAIGQLEAGGWAIALSGICDILDGRLARGMNLSSKYGNFIDATLDRFVETFAFLGFAVYFAAWPWGPLVVAAGLGFSILVSYTQARGEAVGVDDTVGLMQRAERLTLQILGCLFDPLVSRWLGKPEGTVLFWVLVATAVGAGVTALHRTIHIGLKLRR
jgi:CDP-diacylglycerol---glycerol-3-phosphate 3-phosphatidyltransferase